MLFDKDVKSIQWGKDNLFNKWVLKNLIATCQTMKLVPQPNNIYKN